MVAQFLGKKIEKEKKEITDKLKENRAIGRA
jgi:hypothetical protein